MKNNKQPYLERQHTPAKINKLARRSLEKPEWGARIRHKVGAILLKLLLDTAIVAKDEINLPPTLSNTLDTPSDVPVEPAFVHKTDWVNNKRIGIIVPSLQVLKILEKSDSRNEMHEARFLPMIVTPLPWTDPTSGGYLLHSTRQRYPVMRFRGSRMQVDELEQASPNLKQVYKSLDILSSTPWRISSDVYQVMEQAWEDGGGIADLPSRSDVDIPDFPEHLKKLMQEQTAREEEAAAKKENQTEDEIDDTMDMEDPLTHEITEQLRAWRKETKFAVTKNRNLHSLRCDLTYKLQVARQFLGKKFYFPHNMDFRGRVYPIPPHLNHLGQDACRGLLTFDEGRPLGPNGLFWLKVQLANVYGQDKLPFEERVEFVDANLKNVLDSADYPLTGERWWLEGDKPWQILAASKDVAAALRHPDGPEEYVSFLPIHQDGSCNGLQHYAALGRDAAGGKHVNLVPCPSPQDIYSGVLESVVKRIAEDAAEGDELAKKLLHSIDRKIIKQTVMTTVYGVTKIGARAQIENAMKDRDMVPREDLFRASMYITSKVFDSLGDTFAEAQATMKWLGDCATVIAKSGNKTTPVTWTTPLGLPVIQPYRKGGKNIVQTVVQRIFLAESHDDLSVNTSKQKTAFPPNYVHSLDSTHMMMTTLGCHDRGLTFAAVHDSFWTHASTVDSMNMILRDAFIDLHSRDLLGNLRDEFRYKHPGLVFPELPPRGQLDLLGIKDSKYFFH